MAIPISRLRTASADDIQKLQDAGMESLEHFYNIASHQDTRAELAQKTGIPDNILEAWASEADNIILITGLFPS